jgi:hypothetical protein
MGKHLVFRIWTLAAATLAWTGCGLVGLGDVDMDASYASYADAEADGTVKRGWIPDFVPHSATGIQESHNLDTNEQWMTFHFNATDLPSLQQKLTPLKLGEVRFPREASTRERSWWPDDLYRPMGSQAEKYDFFSYRSDRRTVIVAIERNAAVAWCWDSH